MNRMTRRELMQTGLAVLGTAAVNAPLLAGEREPTTPEFSFHHDHVLGTSLDGWIIASSADVAAAAEHLVLDEIERLRQVFSPFDPDSELSRLNRSAAPFRAS